MAATDTSPDARLVAPNQPPPLEGHNVFLADAALREGLERDGGGWARERAVAAGIAAGDPAWIERGTQANEHGPTLETFDRFGNRIDEVAFHPAWHDLLALHVAHGTHALAWQDPQPGAHVARAALFITLSQVEAGVGCPVSMTYSVVPALRRQPELAEAWEPRMRASTYEPRLDPPGGKASALAGMAMTEKQGGSDVRANLTVAEPRNGGGPGAEYGLTGHKWFCSAPMCDVFLVLAQAPGGLTCFLVPRILPDGARNVFRLQRLKDKLGNRSNASSEVEFDGTTAWMVGEEGRGVPTIIEMVNHTRLDCVLGAAAGMRLGTAQAIWHAAHRSAFGRTLSEQPLMANVLADLAVESEAATVTALRLARAYDEAASGDDEAAAFRRLATAVAKYWTCKRAPMHAAEALECLGGNGYVEASGMPRLFRESPLNSIWEGSGNVQCLDVLRAMAGSRGALEALLIEIRSAQGADARLDAASAGLEGELLDLAHAEPHARRIVERMALALQGSLLVRHADPAVADAFCASRLGVDGCFAFGTLPAGVDTGAIVARHLPAA